MGFILLMSELGKRDTYKLLVEGNHPAFHY